MEQTSSEVGLELEMLEIVNHFLLVRLCSYFGFVQLLILKQAQEVIVLLGHL